MILRTHARESLKSVHLIFNFNVELMYFTNIEYSLNYTI